MSPSRLSMKNKALELRVHALAWSRTLTASASDSMIVALLASREIDGDKVRAEMPAIRAFLAEGGEARVERDDTRLSENPLSDAAVRTAVSRSVDAASPTEEEELIAEDLHALADECMESGATLADAWEHAANTIASTWPAHVDWIARYAHVQCEGDDA